MKIKTFTWIKLVSIFLLSFHNLYSQINSPAPQVVLRRDDHVATVEMDYNPYGGWGGNLWSIGNTGIDACGYRLSWWPDASSISLIDFSLGCGSNSSAGTTEVATEFNPYQIVSSNKMVQIQPLANNVLYHLKVEKLNGFGQVCSPSRNLQFMGGDSTRVSQLRSAMTFFDDFNLPMGPNDERKWNSASTPQTDPRFNLFFINAQCHTHSLNGTLNDAAGDKSQTAQRPRKPILIEATTPRRIVFDMDGIFSDRSVWYLDFNPVNTDLTGHMSFFDFDGDKGLPADVCRIKAEGHQLSVSLVDNQGANLNVAKVDLSTFGRAMMTNVRRNFDIRLAANGIKIFVDSVEVINKSFEPGAFKPGVYYPLWSVIGYNTSKDDVPYFLSHWDNFGFDGPNLEPFVIHNYVSQITGSDLKKSYREGSTVHEALYHMHIPDDVRPIAQGVKNDIYLVWTYLKNDYSTFSIQDGDSVSVNGISFPMPKGGNNSSPLDLSLVDYSGSTITNRIKIGEAMHNGPSILLQGDNHIAFKATNSGICNVHIEVMCPSTAIEPPYTPPAHLHHFAHHHDLPNTGTAALITSINNKSYSHLSDDTFVFRDTLSGVVPIEVTIGNSTWAEWAPDLMLQPAQGADFWSIGSTKGIEKVELYLRKKGNIGKGFLLSKLNTAQEAPTPQLRYRFDLNTTTIPDGKYEIFVQAVDPNGVLSHPAYPGFGFRFDVSELSGAFTGVEVNISNGIPPAYTFNGNIDNNWLTNSSWNEGRYPPKGFLGEIIIAEDCIVPLDEMYEIKGELIVKSNKKLTLKK